MNRKRRINREISIAELINLWLVKYYGTTIDDAFANDPWTISSEFYQRYPCTQEQHDEWEVEAKALFTQRTKYKGKIHNASWSYAYLDSSPMVITERHYYLKVNGDYRFLTEEEYQELKYNYGIS